MVRFPAIGIDFFLLQNVQVESLAHPPSYSMNTGVSFPRVTPLPRYEAHHLPPSSTAVTPTFHIPSQCAQ